MDAIAQRGAQSSINDCDRPCPSGRPAPHFDWKTADREASGWQRLKIVQFFDMAISDIAAGSMSLPNERGIPSLGIFFHRIYEGRIPAPAVGAGDAYSPFKQIKCRFASHAATLGDIVGPAVGGARARIYYDDLKRREIVPYPFKLAFDILCSCDIAV